MQQVVQTEHSEDDEVDDGKGESARQKATAYQIYTGDRLICLIDITDIGDTRGIDQSKENMVNTLSVLKDYDILHRLSTLLKQNNTRISVIFKFRINALLIHLHRHAASKVMFDFKNTWGVTPGDAVGPLATQLKFTKACFPVLIAIHCTASIPKTLNKLQRENRHLISVIWTIIGAVGTIPYLNPND